MALTKSNVKVTNITELATEPNATDGLTDLTFKALFDKSALDNKNYINNVLTAELDALFANIKLIMNPVGTILMTTENTNPSTYIGGTWVAWGSGRVPIGVDTNQTEFDTVEETGGEKAHTLTEAETYPHSHPVKQRSSNPTSVASLYSTNYTAGSQEYNLTAAAKMTNTGNTENIFTTSIGGGQAHNNMPPYITCYMWKRTA